MKLVRYKKVKAKLNSVLSLVDVIAPSLAKPYNSGSAEIKSTKNE
jgi:hypothetical protein